MPDITYSTLEQIETKVRRITRSPSEAQLSTDEIDDYINTFVLYDFPEHLRLSALRTVFSFYTSPYVDTYKTDTTDSDSPLYNFKNKFVSVHPPMYVAGNPVVYSQNRQLFFDGYPMVNAINSIGVTGNAATTSFAGTLTNRPVLRNNVSFVSTDANNNGIILVDLPQTDATGILIVPNDETTSYGTINYVTGVYSFTFPVAPGAGQAINSQTIPYQKGLPQAVLYYDSTFTVRPVPDQPYRVTMEVYARPTELLDEDDTPELAEWWQYIAYGAAKKVFEDRMDMDSVQLIMPEFKKQETLILRRTIDQYTNERVATIYTQGGPGNYNDGKF